MSWSLFKTKCNVLTGPQHISTELCAQTITSGYHQAVSLHFDSMSAGGKIVNNAPKLPILYNQFLAQCKANLAQHNEIHILNQMGPMILNYWAGIIIQGPTGTSSVLNPGTWTGIPVVQNFDFQIILNAMITCFRTHIMTLQGQYVSSVLPGVTSSWAGPMLQSLP